MVRHQLSWREGTRTAVISTHVEENPDLSNYGSAGAHRPPRGNAEPDCGDWHPLSPAERGEATPGYPAAEDLCSARNPGVRSILYIICIFKLCGPKRTLLKSPREAES